MTCGARRRWLGGHRVERKAWIFIVVEDYPKHLGW